MKICGVPRVRPRSLIISSELLIQNCSKIQENCLPPAYLWLSALSCLWISISYKLNLHLFINSPKYNLELQSWALLLCILSISCLIDYLYGVFKDDHDGAHLQLHTFWAETGESGVLGHPQIHREFVHSLGYMKFFYLKTKIKHKLPFSNKKEFTSLRMINCDNVIMFSFLSPFNTGRTFTV